MNFCLQAGVVLKARLRFFQHFRYFYVSNHQSPYADRCSGARHDGERRSRNVVAYNAYGDAREYELKLEVSFRLSAPDGAQYLPDTVIAAVREISYNEEDYLNRDAEEALVINEMLSDIVVQMVRRIEKTQPPKQPEDLTTR